MITEIVDSVALCQYCDKERTHRGYFGSSPVSLCEEHRRLHGKDFDRVVRVVVRQTTPNVAFHVEPITVDEAIDELCRRGPVLVKNGDE